MIIKEIAFKLERLEIKSWVLNSLILAVNDAIVEGANDIENFHGALHALTCMSYELEQEMKKLCNDLFEIVKANKNGGM